LLDYQNNYVETTSKLIAQEYQHFLQHCSLCLSILQNNFDSSKKLFSDLYQVKFLDISAKSSFSRV